MSASNQLQTAAGVALVALGTVGIALPLLPTTPFLLLAAYLFARSNRRCHEWLLGHKHLGPYIHAFRHKTGLTRTQKLRIGIAITIVMGASVCYTPLLAVRCLLAIMWVSSTIMLFRMKTVIAATHAEAKAGEVAAGVRRPPKPRN